MTNNFWQIFLAFVLAEIVAIPLTELLRYLWSKRTEPYTIKCLEAGCDFKVTTRKANLLQTIADAHAVAVHKKYNIEFMAQQPPTVSKDGVIHGQIGWSWDTPKTWCGAVVNRRQLAKEYKDITCKTCISEIERNI